MCHGFIDNLCMFLLIVCINVCMAVFLVDPTRAWKEGSNSLFTVICNSYVCLLQEV